MPGFIYLIEDEKAITTLLKYNLEKEGYKFEFSDSGEEGLRNIKKKIPDLVLLDWMLPDISGIEICKNIKKNNLLKNIPVIMLTAKGEEEDKLKLEIYK